MNRYLKSLLFIFLIVVYDQRALAQAGTAVQFANEYDELRAG
jgi:hypothetical protein